MMSCWWCDFSWLVMSRPRHLCFSICLNRDLYFDLYRSRVSTVEEKNLPYLLCLSLHTCTFLGPVYRSLEILFILDNCIHFILFSGHLLLFILGSSNLCISPLVNQIQFSQARSGHPQWQVQMFSRLPVTRRDVPEHIDLSKWTGTKEASLANAALVELSASLLLWRRLPEIDLRL